MGFALALADAVAI